MKVIYVYRAKAAGRYSIENVFSPVQHRLQSLEEVEISEFVWSNYSLLANIMKLRRMKADVYHITGDVNYVAIFLAGKPIVLTIHDLGHYLYDVTGLRRIIYFLVWFLLPIKFAAKVTVISKATGDILRKNIPWSAKKLVHVPNCVGDVFSSAAVTEVTGLKRLLHIGTGANKNLERLIKAIDNSDFEITIVGQLSEVQRDLLSTSNVNSRVLCGLTSAELVREYRRCDAVCFISLSEGFGLPIIEAQAMKKPVLTSDCSPMREVAGPGAWLVNPECVSSIRSELHPKSLVIIYLSIKYNYISTTR